MKRKFVQIAALGLVIALLATGSITSSSAAEGSNLGGTVLRVGLYYGSDALDGANLANSVGTGFQFGFYDGGNQFTALAYTEQTAISVVKTENVYYGTGYVDGEAYKCYYDDLTDSSVAVGCYHLQLLGTYDSFETALAAANEFRDGFVAYIDGSYYVRIGNYVERSLAENAQSELAQDDIAADIAGTSPYGVSVVITGTNTILFQYDDNGTGTGLGVQPNQFGGGEKPVTWFRRIRYYGGFRYERIKGGDLVVVNMVGLEDYVKGVVPHEMSNSWPIEALKAQAVAARSYAITNLNRHSSYHFDVCCTTECQAYSGLSRAGSNSDAAVDSTAGVLAYYNGKVAATFYYSSNGGASESSSVVWNSSQSNYPYLLGVVDPYESSLTTLNNNWTRPFTSDVLVAKLRERGYNGVGSSIVSVAVTALTDVGNPKTVTFTDNNGKRFTLTTYEVMRMLALPSYRYGFDTVGGDGNASISINGTTTVDGVSGLYAIDGNGNCVAVSGDAYVITDSGIAPVNQGGGTADVGTLSSTTGSNGTFTFIGKGSGHNVGMSQWGAYAMAQQGYTYEEILKFYYTGITVG